MTFQMPDHVIYEGEDYVILRRQAEGLPTPRDFGLEISMGHSANWRGYLVTLACRDGQVRLKNLHISGRVNKGEWKDIEGKEAQPLYAAFVDENLGDDLQEFRIVLGRTYYDLDLPTHITGRILIGGGHRRDWPQGFAIVMPYSYESVLVLVVEDGEIVEVIDRSEKAAEWRDLIARRRDHPSDDTRPDDDPLAARNLHIWKGKEDWF